MKSYSDPGEDFEIRPRRKRKGGPVPPGPSLFDSFKEPPPPPFQIRSHTSIDAASEIKEETRAKRRELVYKLVKGSKNGLARFQLAATMGCPEHWLTSSIDALIVMRKVEYHQTRTLENPLSGKQCSIIVKIESGEAEGAA